MISAAPSGRIRYTNKPRLSLGYALMALQAADVLIVVAVDYSIPPMLPRRALKLEGPQIQRP
jgi:hypothetical protein